MCGDKLFGCSHSYIDDEISYEIYTAVPLDGLDLPYLISFDDSANTVPQKIGLPSEAGQFSPDDPDGLPMTLLQDGGRTLTLLDNFRDPIADYAYRYALIFTEKIEEKTENGTVRAERTLAFYFDFDQSGISRFVMNVSEYGV